MSDGKIDKKLITGEKLLGSTLSEDRIDEIAKREMANDKFKVAQTVEGKKNSLRNLRIPTKAVDDEEIIENIPDIDIESLPDKDELPLFYLKSYKILNKEEQILYIRKWKDYTAEFEFNESSDEALLNVVIMEEIIYNRLLRSQLMNPHEDLSKQMSECTKRQEAALNSLGISRKQRLGTKAGKEENIATLIQDFDKNKLLEITEKEKAEEDEEEQLLKIKRKQFAEDLEEAHALEQATDHRDDAVAIHVKPEDIKQQEEAKRKAADPKVVDVLRNIINEAALQ